MTDFTLASRTIPLEDGFDVLVAGGGPAGCTAAAAAAREGARTLLVESTGCLGGMGTAGLLNNWMAFGDLRQLILRGLAGRVFRESKAALPHLKPEDQWGPIDTERLKTIYDD